MNAKSQTSLCRWVRESREAKYRTAKEYWEAHQNALKVSYPHYSTIEAGKKHPDIELAIAIAKTLKLDLRIACHLWARDQMPDAETMAFFEPVPGKELFGIPTAIKNPLDDFYVFTEKQIPAFEARPYLWDSLLFIMAFGREYPITDATIAEAFNYDLKKVEDDVEWLRNEGLVYSEKGALRPRRKYYHLPNTAEFKKVRDQNFKRISSDLLGKLESNALEKKESYRTTFMRRITRKQALEISSRIDDMIGHLGNLDEAGLEFYALTVAFGPRARVSLKNRKQL